MGKKGGRMTPIQVQMLVDILYENPEIASGKFASNFSREDRNNKWEAISILLNSKGLGPSKTSEQWRKSWADLKCAIRSKAAKLELTGGIDLLNEKLTNLEKRILRLTGDIIIEQSGEKKLEVTGKLLLKKLEADLEKTEDDLMNAMKSNQIVLPLSISRCVDVPEVISIKTPFIQNAEVKEKSDEKDNSICIENRNEVNFNDSDDDIIYDDSDINEETFDEPVKPSVKEPLSPPVKRRRTSSVDKTPTDSSETKSFVSVFQKQIETQTAILKELKEQKSVMKDMAKSLRLIASALHDR